MPAVYVMHDSTGPWPVIWREPEPLREEPDRDPGASGEGLQAKTPGDRRRVGKVTRWWGDVPRAVCGLRDHPVT